MSKEKNNSRTRPRAVAKPSQNAIYHLASVCIDYWCSGAERHFRCLDACHHTIISTSFLMQYVTVKSELDWVIFGWLVHNTFLYGHGQCSDKCRLHSGLSASWSGQTKSSMARPYVYGEHSAPQHKITFLSFRCCRSQGLEKVSLLLDFFLPNQAACPYILTYFCQVWTPSFGCFTYVPISDSQFLPPWTRCLTTSLTPLGLMIVRGKVTLDRLSLR